CHGTATTVDDGRQEDDGTIHDAPTMPTLTLDGGQSSSAGSADPGYPGAGFPAAEGPRPDEDFLPEWDRRRGHSARSGRTSRRAWVAVGAVGVIAALAITLVATTTHGGRSSATGDTNPGPSPAGTPAGTIAITEVGATTTAQ